MIITKIQDFFKSFRNKVIVIIALIVVVSALLISKYVLNKETSPVKNEVSGFTDDAKDNKQVKKVDIEQLSVILSPGIDSVLKNFGIKNEWITNSADDKNLKKGSNPKTKEAELFTKNVIIPMDLTSIEVNADITSYAGGFGLKSIVNEDIITKDIVLLINNGDTASGKLPIAKLNITHSDKVHRESSIICVIINNINEYSPEDVDKLLINKSEFSFVFPRNLDDIDLQNKLLHSKKDVIINMTVGGKDNYETDFNSAMDTKAIHERVKSFSVDFPTVPAVLLTKKDSDVSPQVMSAITNDFASYKIKVINDFELAQLLSKAEDDSKEKYNVFTANLKNKGSLAKSIITTISVSKDDFAKFYDDILTLKKLGYKFCNFSDFAARKDEFEKQEQLKQDKAKDDKQKLDDLKKKQEQKKIEKKKNDVKVPPQKKQTDKKKTDKKKTETKKTEPKKTETKKKTDVKKK
ncbi:MAG: hypothetical protein ABI543_04615 [Ignavibacteria bacterium]